MRRQRVLVRLYVYGGALLALMWLALFVVVRLVVAPAVTAGARPLAAWVVPRLVAERASPARLRAEVADAKTKLNLDVTLYDVEGRQLASNVEPPLAALGADDLGRLREQRVMTLGDTPEIAAGVFEGSELIAYGVVVRPPRNLTLRAATIALVVALVILAFAAVPLARTIVRPLERLAGVTRAFGQGDLSARAGPYPNDEIGELARVFDEMADRVGFLLRAEKELLANVSHELRTPLARIRVVLDLASESDPERMRRYLGEISEDLGELERLVDDVLTTTRFDLARGRFGEGTPPLRIERVAVADIAVRAATRFEQHHEGRELGLDVTDGLPEIDADPAMLRRVIDNLLDNAAKYSDPGTPISLSASLADDEVVLQVSDRGIGIPPEDLPMVFQPFFRGDKSRTRRTGGVGLGLALARAIVEAHRGRMTLDSRAGEGTVVRIAIPVPAPTSDGPVDRRPVDERPSPEVGP